MIRFFRPARLELSRSILRREVHNFDGKIRQNLYTYMERRRDQILKQVNDRYAIANVPNKTKAKVASRDALFKITGESLWLLFKYNSKAFWFMYLK